MRRAKIFYSSSACVYNNDKQTAFEAPSLKEADAYHALAEHGYGWEKLYSERMCRHFREDGGAAKPAVAAITIKFGTITRHFQLLLHGVMAQAPKGILNIVLREMPLGRSVHVDYSRHIKLVSNNCKFYVTKCRSGICTLFNAN